MILKTESKELYELIKSFYEVTGIKTAVYNTNFEEILAYPKENSPICCEMDKVCAAGCGESNAILCSKCHACGDVVINKCHAGLTEVAAPLEENGEVIGYIMYGQITNEPDRERFVNGVSAAFENYGIGREFAEKYAESIKFYSDSQLKAISRIINAMTSYIVLKRYAYMGEKPIVYAVMDYISDNLDKDLSPAALCRKFGVSRSELYKISRPYMPDGIAEFVKSARLLKACELLKKSDMPVWQIAEKIGFSDKEYFQRVFKKKYGVSAGKYRK